MKIGFKGKNYDDVIYFDLKDIEDKEIFINNLINSASVGGENEVDLIIKPNKKELKSTDNPFEKD